MKPSIPAVSVAYARNSSPFRANALGRCAMPNKALLLHRPEQSVLEPIRDFCRRLIEQESRNCGSEAPAYNHLLANDDWTGHLRQRLPYSFRSIFPRKSKNEEKTQFILSEPDF